MGIRHIKIKNLIVKLNCIKFHIKKLSTYMIKYKI